MTYICDLAVDLPNSNYVGLFKLRFTWNTLAVAH